MEPTKIGRCQLCRWIMIAINANDPEGELIYGCFRFPPSRMGGQHSVYARVELDMTCGEWEPMEGKRCGNCAEFESFEPGGGTGCCWIAEIRTKGEQSVRASGDTCAAWAWAVPEMDDGSE